MKLPMQFLLACIASTILAPFAQAADPPNIVYILADDLGYGDLGCYNKQSKIPAPNCDRLALEGLRFTDAHTPSAVCTPTRYGVLTGRYCWRTWLKRSVLDGIDPPLIEPDRLTVAKLLREHGYATACIGKWHLGMQWTTRDGVPVPRRDLSNGFRPGDDVDFTKPVTGGPLDCGFDEYFGISASLDMPPYCFMEQDHTVGTPSVRAPQQKDLFLNQPPGQMVEGFALESVLPRITSRAVKFIETQSAAKKPFFLYMPLNAPHLPIVPNKPFAGKSEAGQYGDFVCEVDATVGAVMATLEKCGVADNTLLILTSDNGGLWHWWELQERDDVAQGRITPRGQYVKQHGHQSNAHLRGTKADGWEGGHRVPFIARWPARIPRGETSDELIELTDLLATTAAILDVELPNNAGEDSFNILPAMLEADPKQAVRPAAIHHTLHGLFAVRQGDWKYIAARGSGGFSRPREIEAAPGETTVQLYNLREDPSETRNAALEHPEIVKRLAEYLERCQQSGRSRDFASP